MSVSVTMPRLGESVTEGTVTRWLKHEGDHVEADEPLLEVSTDKVDTEVPSPASGVLTSIKVQEDETGDIGVELAVTGDAAGADSSAPTVEGVPEPEPARRLAPPPPSREPAAPAESDRHRPPKPRAEAAVQRQRRQRSPPTADGDDRTARTSAFARTSRRRSGPTTRASPAARARRRPPKPRRPRRRRAPVGLGRRRRGGRRRGRRHVRHPAVRRLASENGVDLSTVTGTGVGGRIRKSDVIAAAEQAAEATATRRQLNSRAAQAARTAPVDATA
jgi:2-oxoglutarate dehydrogenase E2 component (dihydrolipoamide succinyltransferase)